MQVRHIATSAWCFISLIAPLSAKQQLHSPIALPPHVESGDIPVSLGILIDKSSSMSGKQLAVQTAGAALVRDTKMPDRVFLVNFEQEAYLDVQFTNDIRKL